MKSVLSKDCQRGLMRNMVFSLLSCLLLPGQPKKTTYNRYAFPWWKGKEMMSEERRLQGLCPLTPEEMALILRAMDFNNNTQIYIASGEIYGSQKRLAVLRNTFPRLVRKETLLHGEELKQFKNHSSQMAALDFIVSVASDVFVPSDDGNMAKLVEGHRGYLGYKKTLRLDRKRLIDMIDLHQNGTLSWAEFSTAVAKFGPTT